MPRISVVIPFHNREGTLARCLESLLEQDFPADDFEIVAVDNNSADGSGLVARQYSRVLVLQEGGRRVPIGRETAACVMRRGALSRVTDSDCVAAPDWLSRIERAMRDATLQVLIGKSEPAGHSRAVRLLGAYEEHKDRYVFSTTRSEKYYGHTSNMAVRREVFAQMGPFVEWQRGADSAFVRKAVDKFGCDAIRYDPDIFVKHLELASAVTYFKKAYAYGRARQLGNRVINIEALSTAERFRIFQNTTRQQALSLMDTGRLLTLLVIGAGCWYAGNFSPPPSVRGRCPAMTEKRPALEVLAAAPIAGSIRQLFSNARWALKLTWTSNPGLTAGLVAMYLLQSTLPAAQSSRHSRCDQMS